jgi:hypothetical protein
LLFNHAAFAFRQAANPQLIYDPSFRPAGRGRRSAASLPSEKFAKDIIPQKKLLQTL